MLLLLLFAPLCWATLEEPELTFERLYQFGKEAYRDKRWEDCIGFMKKSLEDYDYYTSEVEACAARCLKKLPLPVFGSDVDTEYYRFALMHHTSERALCVMRCRRQRLSSRRPLIYRREIVHDFLERRPFNYLQLCYWKDDNFESAARAAYTYLVANPTSEEARENMAFYMEQPQFAEYMLEDQMRADYEKMFISGVTAYGNEDWQKCITHLDTALEEFYKEEAKCRLGCRDRVDWLGIGSDADVDVVIASMHKSVATCQHDCLRRLSWINGHDFRNVVAEVFRYQHICYYKQMRGQDAARAVANHLLLDRSPDMRWNRHHYQQLYPDRPEIFRPDARTLNFAKQRALEERYLAYFDRRFQYFPTEHKEDYEVLAEVDRDALVVDDFPYEAVPRLLSADLCTVLRRAALQLPSSYEATARMEAERLVQTVFPQAKLQGLWCGGLRRAVCDRAVVLSLEKGDGCSAWLGHVHDGCALVACE